MSLIYQALGCGVGLRSQHYPVITQNWPKMDWFEALTENYMDTGGRPFRILEQVRHHYPVALHGTALSIGSTDPLSETYLVRLKRLIQKIQPFVVSDHLCWSGVNGYQLHDLLPLPFTGESVRHVVSRVQHVQDFLGQQILLENVSTYVTYKHSEMPEWEFLSEIAERSGCGILLDINNLYVNAYNHKIDPHEYLRNIPGERIGQMHLAGHTNMGDFLFDTHSAPVIDQVWNLYEEALNLFGPVSTLIEWDDSIPDYDKLVEEAEKARKIYKEAERKGIQPRSQREKQADGRATIKSPPVAVSLASLQEGFLKRMETHEEISGKAFEISALLNPQAKTPGIERISVYADGYPARVQLSLLEVYEAVHKVLGSEMFYEIVYAYALAYPSHDYNLNYVGRHFPEFIQTLTFEKGYPFIADLARFEWSVWETFHAFDKEPFGPQQLAGIPPEDWEKLQIVFQPSVRLFSSEWQVMEMWLAKDRSVEELKPLFAKEPEKVMLAAKAGQVRCEKIDLHRYTLIEKLLSGESLGSVCEILAEQAGEEEVPVGEWFSGWVQEGLLADCLIPQKTRS